MRPLSEGTTQRLLEPSLYLWLLLGLGVAWWVFDRPGRNPFLVNRVLRLVVLVLLVALGTKAMEWNRDVRSLIVERCR